MGEPELLVLGLEESGRLAPLERGVRDPEVAACRDHRDQGAVGRGGGDEQQRRCLRPRGSDAALAPPRARLPGPGAGSIGATPRRCSSVSIDGSSSSASGLPSERSSSASATGAASSAEASSAGLGAARPSSGALDPVAARRPRRCAPPSAWPRRGRRGVSPRSPDTRPTGDRANARRRPDQHGPLACRHPDQPEEPGEHRQALVDRALVRGRGRGRWRSPRPVAREAPGAPRAWAPPARQAPRTAAEPRTRRPWRSRRASVAPGHGWRPAAPSSRCRVRPGGRAIRRSRTVRRPAAPRSGRARLPFRPARLPTP